MAACVHYLASNTPHFSCLHRGIKHVCLFVCLIFMFSHKMTFCVLEYGFRHETAACVLNLASNRPTCSPPTHTVIEGYLVQCWHTPLNNAELKDAPGNATEGWHHGDFNYPLFSHLRQNAVSWRLNSLEYKPCLLLTCLLPLHMLNLLVQWLYNDSERFYLQA